MKYTVLKCMVVFGTLVMPQMFLHSKITIFTANFWGQQPPGLNQRWLQRRSRVEFGPRILSAMPSKSIRTSKWHQVEQLYCLTMILDDARRANEMAPFILWSGYASTLRTKELYICFIVLNLSKPFIIIHFGVQEFWPIPISSQFMIGLGSISCPATVITGPTRLMMASLYSCETSQSCKGLSREERGLSAKLGWVQYLYL